MAADHRPKPRRWALAAPAALYAVLVFGRATANTFWLDDYGWVRNAILASREPIALLALEAGFFRPVVNLVFLANYLLSGLDPAGYYWVNIALHVINASLVATLAYRLSGHNGIAAGVAGLLFAGAVGNYGEAVIWICGRTELVATAFGLSTLLLYLRFAETGRRRFLACATATYALALLSKESAVVWLPAIVLLDLTANRRLLPPARRLLRVALFAARYAPFAALLVAYAAYQYAVQSGHGLYADHYRLGWHALANWVEYISLMFVPVTARSTIIALPGSAQTALAVLAWGVRLAILASVAALLAFRAPAHVRFAALFTLMAIVPYSLFDWKTTTRYLYIPSVGLAIALGWAIEQAWALAAGIGRPQIGRAHV